MVYLKELDQTGWVIYSNWGTSQKAQDFETNRWVSLCFWWKGLERQVRVEGKGQRLSTDESQRYFDTRARGSRLGAWASQQTSVLRSREQRGSRGVGNGDREGDGADVKEPGEQQGQDDGRSELEEQVDDVEKRFEGQETIPVPGFWGGLRVVPETVEFWQGRDSRLHDRLKYAKVDPGKGDGGGDWKIDRLSP